MTEPVVNGEDAQYEVHPAFVSAGRQPGTEVWRIEQFEPVPVEDNKHGQFHKGDCYIVLRTQEVNRRLSWNIHFWLGAESKQDQSGTAAIRTVELDDSLGGAAVQHRETQGHESKVFLSYFKGKIRYLEGGAGSGFTHVDHGKFEKKLYQVECLCATLNQGDTFVLDAGPNVWVWMPPKTSKTERLAGVALARSLRDEEKGGRAKIHIVEDDWDTNPEFFKALGSHDKHIKTASTDLEDDTVRKLDQELLLYKISANTDNDNAVKKEFKIEEVAERPIHQSVLDSKFCYVLDSGYSGIYVWTGKKCEYSFKKKVWDGVNEFLAERGLPSWMSVSRVVDGGESDLFKQYFATWADPNETIGLGQTHKQSHEEFDASSLHASRPPKIEDRMPDDGTGKLQVWRIDNRELSSIPEEAYGVFFGEDCYVMQYTYTTPDNRDHHLIYFWQGLASNTEERAASALQAISIDDSLGGEAVQIRVVQGREPLHFLKIFKGKVVYLQGGRSIGFKNLNDHNFYNPRESYMFHIIGEEHDVSRAVEVACRGASLNTNDVFVVDAPGAVYVWIGQHAPEGEAEMARLLVDFLAPEKGVEPTIMDEGQEPTRFWDAIGGQEKYYTGPQLKDTRRIAPRLFHCSVTTGRFIAEEIGNFQQTDLSEDCVMLLDTYDEIFLWVGTNAKEIEKKESLKLAYNYLKSDPTGRTEDNTLIVVVTQGYEPLEFTGHFQPWEASLWNEGKSFADICREVGEENAGICLGEEEANKYTATHALEILQRQLPPQGVDVTCKEMYLTDEDFVRHFQMSKEEFKLLPQWKQIQRKKALGLF